MPEDKPSVVCGDCGTVLNEKSTVCPSCGSTSKEYSLRAEVKARARATGSMEAYRGEEKKSFLKWIEEFDFYWDTLKWRLVQMVFNKEKKAYIKTVYDPDTGEFLYGPRERPLKKKSK